LKWLVNPMITALRAQNMLNLQRLKKGNKGRGDYYGTHR
jgi:hypothetical protein